ncbi:50S ribosomal protein L9 [Candidatus Poribacteria bacterium]|nr:50S ribosomal protein L9 [Candidatus Poribacteria bacterium]
MKVILLQDIQSLGKKNDTIEIKDGYARNYLIPRGKACDVNPRSLSMVDEQRRRIAALEKKEKQAADALCAKIAALNCTISCQAGEQDKLFGSVTNQDIHKNLAAQGMNIDKRDILLEEPIKSLGVFFVDIRIAKELKTTLKVWVVKEEKKETAVQQ